MLKSTSDREALGELPGQANIVGHGAAHPCDDVSLQRDVPAPVKDPAPSASDDGGFVYAQTGGVQIGLGGDLLRRTSGASSESTCTTGSSGREAPTDAEFGLAASGAAKQGEPRPDQLLVEDDVEEEDDEDDENDSEGGFDDDDDDDGRLQRDGDDDAGDEELDTDGGSSPAPPDGPTLQEKLRRQVEAKKRRRRRSCPGFREKSPSVDTVISLLKKAGLRDTLRDELLTPILREIAECLVDIADAAGASPDVVNAAQVWTRLCKDPARTLAEGVAATEVRLLLILDTERMLERLSIGTITPKMEKELTALRAMTRKARALPSLAPQPNARACALTRRLRTPVAAAPAAREARLRHREEVRRRLVRLLVAAARLLGRRRAVRAAR